MLTKHIREEFLKFFEANDHKRIKSSDLVPHNDKSLLFTNSGMVQFKDYFTGQIKPDFSKATTSQKCIRAGGKHNDLENVGYTARHHTFFEMLGNFSFGDYFKEQAILYAWEFVTKTLQIPKDKLWVSVYYQDQESFKIWNEIIGFDKNKISLIKDKDPNIKYQSDNFWQMGDSGPCGPCTEIFYDHGDKVFGGPPGSKDEDGDRFIEIWNLVFMQFNKISESKMIDLPKPSVDTGMGLERISAVLQGVHSNYETDEFVKLIGVIAEDFKIKNLQSNSLKVIADHIRASAFLVSEGLNPSNEGRGYVLRRIIRRALRHGYKLGKKEPFFYSLVDTLSTAMGNAYPELEINKNRICTVIKNEELKFAETLATGMHILENALNREDKVLDGETVFKLYDTYGFPVDMTADVARERGVNVDFSGFETAMSEQKDRARSSSKFNNETQIAVEDLNTDFLGYNLNKVSSKITSIFVDNNRVDQLLPNQKASIVLNKTVFYGESGGQVGDIGCIWKSGESLYKFNVIDTKRVNDKVFVHIGTLENGVLSVGDMVEAEINVSFRDAVKRNHSATHILHATLKKILGDHASQRGSLVDNQKTRFDFSHNNPLTKNEIKTIEDNVNSVIIENSKVSENFTSLENAKQSGVTAIFGEKYGDQVRVIKIGEKSSELCGGTHVNNSGDIGLFKIINETGVASGIRRIEAVTGFNALNQDKKNEELLDYVSAALKSSKDDIPKKIDLLIEQLKITQKDNEKMKLSLANNQIGNMINNSYKVGDFIIISEIIKGTEIKVVRNLLDEIRNKEIHSLCLLFCEIDKKNVLFVSCASKLIEKNIFANDLAKKIIDFAGGKGGGKKESAQIGGIDFSKVNDIKLFVEKLIRI